MATDNNAEIMTYYDYAASSSLVSYFLALLTTPAYLACLLINQAGSILYYYCLATAPLSLVW